ncbi:MAG: zf-HC2 domain-containing protein [Acidimicrobiia bacterium]
MLSCAQARRAVFDFIDGDLDDYTAWEVESHKNSCTNCPPLVEAILSLLDELRHLPEVEPDRELLESVRRVSYAAPGEGTNPLRTAD